MSGHDLDHRYRLLEAVGQADGGRTYTAQELTTGRPVLVHVLQGASPDAIESVTRQLGHLSGADKALVLETATLQGDYAVVTEPLPGVRSFSAWLAERAGGAGARGPSADENAEGTPASGSAGGGAPDAVGTADATAAEPSEAGGRGGAPASHAGAVPVLPPTIEFQTGPANGPGEFTRLFMGGGRVTVETSTPAPRAGPVGSFTEMFGAAPVSPVAAPPVVVPEPARDVTPAPAPALAPGEFTRLFHAPTPAPADGPAPSPFVPATGSRQAPFVPATGSRQARASTSYSPAPSPAPRASPEPSMAPPLPGPPSAAPAPFAPVAASLGSATAALAAHTPAPVPAGAASDAGSLAAFGGAVPSDGGPPPLVPLVPPPLFGPGPGAGAGPPFGAVAPGAPRESEYTRLIRRSAPPAPAAPPAAPAPAPPDAPRVPVPLPLIFAINLVVLLAFGLVLYFALRPAAPAGPASGVPNAPPATTPTTTPNGSPNESPNAAPAGAAPAQLAPTAR